MPATVHSAALYGIEALPIDVEVDVLPGLPSFTVVGLTDRAIQEARERLVAALSNAGFEPPRRKTIVSLAPASLKKEGSLYDLPIALGYLIAGGQVKPISERISNTWYVGELGLDGTVRSIPGTLPISLAAARQGIKKLVVPKENASEAAAVADQIDVYAVSSLQEVSQYVSGEIELEPITLDSVEKERQEESEHTDIKDIVGQQMAKRALTICAAGGHNILFVGPPGTGKTLLARALAGLLPPLQKSESHTVTSLYSIAGLLPPGRGLIYRRPYRSPHHGASAVAVIGGGTNPKPGEVSLAHTGVLFLDELPEFPRSVLEQLRQPMEDGWVSISRALNTVRFPARFMLVGAMNPCPCGFSGSRNKQCNCTPASILRYQRKVSGPILDRIDIHVLVNDVEANKLLQSNLATETTSSKDIQHTINAARNYSWERQQKTNSELTPKEIITHCSISSISEQLLLKAQDKFHLSSRGLHRLLRVSRTIADLEGKQKINTEHIAEALQYREQLKAALPDFV